MEVDTASSEPYVPSKPARVPGRVTATSISVMADLPAGAARPEAWEVEYGFRYTGGWNSAPWTGQVDQSIPRGKGRGEVWICTIAGLEPDSSYVFRIRARAEGWEARGLGWGDWSERSSVIATLDEQSDEQATKPSGFFSTAGTYLKEGIEGIRREIVSGDMEPPELNEWAAPVQAEAPPVVLTDHNAFEFQPSEGYMQVEDESVCEPSDGRFELGLEIRLYKSKPRQSRTGGKPPNAPPVLCIARIARESVAARKPGLQPGLELISVMDRPAATLLRAGQAQEEIAGSLASIWRTCLELNQPLRMNFSKRVSSQWAPERKPSALQNQERSIPSRTGATQAGSDNDDDSAVKIQHDALQISREDSDLETLNSDDDHDVELDLTTSVALREVERLEAKLAATDALLHGIDDPPDSRAGPQSVAPVRQRGTDDDDSVAPMHENAAVPVSLPDLSIGGASNSGTGALLDELEVLAGGMQTQEHSPKVAQGPGTTDPSALLAELGELASGKNARAPLLSPASATQDQPKRSEQQQRPPPPAPSLRGSLGEVAAEEPGVSV